MLTSDDENHTSDQWLEKVASTDSHVTAAMLSGDASMAQKDAAVSSYPLLRVLVTKTFHV